MAAVLPAPDRPDAARRDRRARLASRARGWARARGRHRFLVDVRRMATTIPTSRHGSRSSCAGYRTWRSAVSRTSRPIRSRSDSPASSRRCRGCSSSRAARSPSKWRSRWPCESFHNRGEPRRRRIVCFENAYHGDDARHDGALRSRERHASRIRRHGYRRDSSARASRGRRRRFRGGLPRCRGRGGWCRHRAARAVRRRDALPRTRDAAEAEARLRRAWRVADSSTRSLQGSSAPGARFALDMRPVSCRTSSRSAKR